ncbi:hypothetical protein BJG92_03462 [Arthrobacter sp. SO5]|uniref:TIR domain-containing protein n=1 Tax=Arthrobacter sp. SO5 TaxID=1897055 RepID=UPI001E41634D|nr:TIR domain-containing protein [Arthrobacter sp. SO5]MCB5275908.1 hypothetical protein [Arthrobacter sp. SO5]
MKVFISWSKERSLIVAKALEEWLPQVINQVQPWMSAKSIESGKLSISQISDALESTNFGIICVTPENQHETWLNFEAGALSKAVKGVNASAIPLLVGFDGIASLKPPLSNYQAHLATEQDIKVIVHSINSALATPRDVAQLDAAFDKWWPDLEVAIKEAEQWAAAPTSRPTQASRERLQEQKLDEVLQAVKTLMHQFDEFAERSVDLEAFLMRTGMLHIADDPHYLNYRAATARDSVYVPAPPLQETITNTISRHLNQNLQLRGSSVSVAETGLITVTTPIPLDEADRSSISVKVFGSRKADERIAFNVDPGIGGVSKQAVTS